MKTFLEWLSESKNESSNQSVAMKLAIKTRPLLSEIHLVNLTKFSFVDNLYELKVFHNKKGAVDSFLKPADEAVKELQEILRDYPSSDEYKETLKTFRKDIEKALNEYSLVRNAYKFWEDVIQKAFSTVKKGDKLETALPKIANMTKQLKYFDIKTMKVNGTFFDEYSVEELKKQLQDHEGVLKLAGPLDFYIMFKDGKVYNMYF